LATERSEMLDGIRDLRVDTPCLPWLKSFTQGPRKQASVWYRDRPAGFQRIPVDSLDGPLEP